MYPRYIGTSRQPSLAALHEHFPPALLYTPYNPRYVIEGERARKRKENLIRTRMNKTTKCSFSSAGAKICADYYVKFTQRAS